MSEEQFGDQKRSIGMIFDSVAQNADAGLRGNGSCKALPPTASTAPDPGRFDRILNEIDK